MLGARRRRAARRWPPTASRPEPGEPIALTRIRWGGRPARGGAPARRARVPGGGTARPCVDGGGKTGRPAIEPFAAGPRRRRARRARGEARRPPPRAASRSPMPRSSSPAGAERLAEASRRSRSSRHGWAAPSLLARRHHERARLRTPRGHQADGHEDRAQDLRRVPHNNATQRPHGRQGREAHARQSTPTQRRRSSATPTTP